MNIEEYLKENYGLDNLDYQTLHDLVNEEGTSIINDIPDDLRSDFIELLVEKAETKWDIDFVEGDDLGRSEFFSQNDVDGNTEVLVVETPGQGLDYHEHFVSAVAQYNLGEENTVKLVGTKLDNEDPYYRLIVSNMSVLQNSEGCQGGLRQYDISEEMNPNLVASETLYIIGAGNEGKGNTEDPYYFRHRIDEGNINNLLQHQTLNAVTYHGDVIHVGAATRGENGEILLSGYSSVNCPDFCALEPISSFHRGLSLSDILSGRTETLRSGEQEGTSFTSPAVAGIAGKIKKENPEFSNQLVIYLLKVSSDPILTREGQENDLRYTFNSVGNLMNVGAGAGIINPEKLAQNIGLAQDLLNNYPCEVYEQNFVPNFEGGNPSREGENLYSFAVEDQANLVSLKITGSSDYKGPFPATIISPNGTEFPITISMNDQNGLFFSVSSAWAGEEVAGEWKLSTPDNIELSDLNIKFEGVRGELINEINKSKPEVYLPEANTINYQNRDNL